MNRAFRPSVIVGCANMASRKTVYGNPASIAVQRERSENWNKQRSESWNKQP